MTQDQNGSAMPNPCEVLAILTFSKLKDGEYQFRIDDKQPRSPEVDEALNKLLNTQEFQVFKGAVFSA